MVYTGPRLCAGPLTLLMVCRRPPSARRARVLFLDACMRRDATAPCRFLLCLLSALLVPKRSLSHSSTNAAPGRARQTASRGLPPAWWLRDERPSQEEAEATARFDNHPLCRSAQQSVARHPIPAVTQPCHGRLDAVGRLRHRRNCLRLIVLGVANVLVCTFLGLCTCCPVRRVMTMLR